MECTLIADGKLEELTHEMQRYNFNVIGLSELCKKLLTKYKLVINSTTLKMKSGHTNRVSFLVNSENVK